MLTAVPKRLRRQVVAVQGSLTAGRPSTSEAGRTPLMPRNHLSLDASRRLGIECAGAAALAAFVSSSYLGMGAGGVGDRIYCGHHIYRRPIIPTMSLSSAGESGVEPPTLQDAGANLSGPVPLLTIIQRTTSPGPPRRQFPHALHSDFVARFWGVVVVWRSGGCLVQGGRAVPALRDIGGRGDKPRGVLFNLCGGQALQAASANKKSGICLLSASFQCRCSCRRMKDGPTAHVWGGRQGANSCSLRS
jgi:hypothetical protein